MRILWIHQYFATLQGWGSARTFETAVRWAQAGHAVDILCTPAYDPSLAGRGEVAVAPGVRAFVSRVRYSPHMGFAARLAAFGGFTGFARRFVRRQGGNYDIAIASSAPLSVAIPALTGRRRWALPYVFETIDVWPDAAIAAGVLRNPLLKALSFRLEAAAYRGASHVVTCSDGMTARVTGKGIPAGKITTISNACDVTRFAPDPAARAATRRAHGVRDDQLVCLYAGAMGRSNAIEDVVEAVRLTADDPRIVWWFAGDGRDAGTLAALARADGRVRFFGRRPQSEQPTLLAGADAALVTFLHAPFFHENSPNKFFDAIAAGLPVVFNRSTWLEPWLDRYGNAFVCREAPAAPAIAEALRRLAGDPALRGRMGAASRRLACEVFDRDRLAARYLAILGAHAARA
jgi:glycosyltransferase involved in cell wall biosynthesis